MLAFDNNNYIKIRAFREILIYLSILLNNNSINLINARNINDKNMYLVIIDINNSQTLSKKENPINPKINIYYFKKSFYI